MILKTYLLDKIFLVFITMVSATCLFFLIPPPEIKDNEQNPGYLDPEFDGLPEVLNFFPRFELALEKSETKVIIEEVKDLDSYTINIPNEKISAPINFNVNALDNNEYLKSLESGVAHFRGTAYPWDKTGNIFIFGHSSYYRDAPGEFKDIFKNLEFLKIDDEIYIQNNKNDNFHYKIVDRKIVTADYTQAFEQDGEFRLTLMTCWPTGTAQKRLILTALPIK